MRATCERMLRLAADAAARSAVAVGVKATNLSSGCCGTAGAGGDVEGACGCGWRVGSARDVDDGAEPLCGQRVG